LPLTSQVAAGLSAAWSRLGPRPPVDAGVRGPQLRSATDPGPT